MELMQCHEVTPMPNSNPYVEGIFNPRGIVMTLFNLPAYLGHPESEDPETDIFIVTNFNKVSAAFRVHTVVEIHRLSWTDIEKPDAAIYGGQDALATGIARVQDRLVTIIDFEKILTDISPESGFNLDEISKLGERERSDRPILMAEDSPVLSKMLVEALTRAGYTNLTICSNGEEAWNILRSYAASGQPVEELVSLVITDVEMPQMDGHRLLTKIRGEAALEGTPVIIFSSIIDHDMRRKGEKLGATAQLSKPEIGSLIDIVDKHVR